MGSKSGTMKRSLNKDRDHPEPLSLAEKQKKLEELELDMDNLAKRQNASSALMFHVGKLIIARMVMSYAMVVRQQ